MDSLGIGILGSGKGSNCRAILEAIQNGTLRTKAKVVVSDVKDAGILSVAKEFGVRSIYLEPGKWRTKLESVAEERLVGHLKDAGVGLVVLAGFMRIIKAQMLDEFPRRIINLHPSLLPKYPGRDAWAQALANGERVTGCTVHYVDAGIDTGEIIAQRKVEILPNDTAESLHRRIQRAEREIFPEVIAALAEKFASGKNQPCSDF